MSAAFAPLLSAGDWGGVAGFERAFVAQHPGYRRIRPAPLPLVVPRALALRLWRTTAALLAELRRVPQAVFGGDAEAWVRALGYLEAEQGWLAGMTGARATAIATSCARADFVLGAQGPRLVEINVGPTIGGIGVLDRYSELLGAAWRVDPGVTLPRPARVWARMLRAVAPAHRPLRVALVVAHDEAAIPHPHEAAHYLRREGMHAEVVGVDALRFDGARAMAPGGAVDVVYGCFTFDQLRAPAHRAFVDRAMACEVAGGPVYVAPPAFTLFGNKAMLARIDPARLPEPAMVAPTRVFDDTAYARALGDRVGQVLKPAIGYGGEGVVIGADCAPAEWCAALERARDSGALHVLQDYVAPVATPVPGPAGTAPYHIGIGCLAFGGRFGGLLLRQTPAVARGLANCRQGAMFSAAGIADARWFARAGVAA